MRLRPGTMLQVKNNHGLMLFEGSNEGQSVGPGLNVARSQLKSHDILLVLDKGMHGWWRIFAYGRQYIVRGKLLHTSTQEP